MTCEGDLKMGLFGSIYFCGFAFGALVILRLGDIYGRKPVLIGSVILSIVLFLALYLANNIILVYILLFWIGTLNITKGTLFYLYFLELIPERKRIKYHTISNIMGLLIGIATMMFFYFIDDGLLCFPILIAISILHSYFLYVWPESPKFLYSRYKFEEAHKAIEYIGKVNGVNQYNFIFASEIGYFSDFEDDLNDITLIVALKDELYRK